jgi:hypothetical protein
MCSSYEQKLDPPRAAVTGVFTELYRAGKLDLETANDALEELHCDLIKRTFNVIARPYGERRNILEVPGVEARDETDAITFVRDSMRVRAVVNQVTYTMSVEVTDDVVEGEYIEWGNEEIDEMGDRFVELLEFVAEEEGI